MSSMKELKRIVVGDVLSKPPYKKTEPKKVGSLDRCLNTVVWAFLLFMSMSHLWRHSA